MFFLKFHVNHIYSKCFHMSPMHSCEPYAILRQSKK